ncbi:MAG: Flp pilus assembly protein CpaB [Labilithrix sp.]|nr:Flp pilus assembly protein CpaB [Labilithrix sp.]
MNAKAVIVALLFGALTAASLVLYTRRLEIEATGGERISVLMLARPLKKDAVVSEDDLSVRQIPVAFVDDRVVRASDRPKVVGVRAERDLEPQQLVTWLDVAVSGLDDRHLSQLVQPGTRALTLHIPESYMSAGLLRPGDWVDVIGVVEEGHSHQSVVLLQKVLVLSVGRETVPSHDARSTTRASEEQLVTIAVSLQDSQVIALAAQKGPVIAVLRSPDDQTISENVPAVTQLPTQRANVTVRPLAPKPTKPTNLARNE